MESKELHLGLLKKKVAELEELLREKGRVEVERDENSLRYKKLVKHNDKLQRELLDYKQQVTSLKAKLLEASELRVSLLNRNHRHCWGKKTLSVTQAFISTFFTTNKRKNQK